ncbi:hypothetical protein MSSAC_0274 [Methanosarcina siciliae C2J]|uniref:Uncharacterized protein n=4 Tax=Methanosarcina siciliae TaxID=38027 RepID=A0A0E3PBZ7_9EURY|nr:hypothetical protein MSSIT_0243 [Methanosarcina siciliae T4/M]AKB30928.1 hypothetical protein MSSIH_0238 [Methanosarcina siciliae HI350]AKB34864.1 hypothetical protein MSSAC_0274 [Methanosarcina siciliae C2J]
MKTKPADMSENNKKTLPVITNGSGSPKKVVHPPYKEITLGCGCGAASCENCPGAMGIKAGSEKDVVYRNVFVYLMIAAVILIATYAVKELLTALLV